MCVHFPLDWCTPSYFIKQNTYCPIFFLYESTNVGPDYPWCNFNRSGLYNLYSIYNICVNMYMLNTPWRNIVCNIYTLCIDFGVTIYIHFGYTCYTICIYSVYFAKLSLKYISTMISPILLSLSSIHYTLIILE